MGEMRRAIAREQDERRTQDRFLSTLVIDRVKSARAFSGDRRRTWKRSSGSCKASPPRGVAAHYFSISVRWRTTVFGALRAPHFLLQMPSFPTVKCRTSGPLALRRRPRHRSFTTRFSIPAAGVNQIPPPASPPAQNDVSSDMRRIDTTPQ